MQGRVKANFSLLLHFPKKLKSSTNVEVTTYPSLLFHNCDSSLDAELPGTVMHYAPVIVRASKRINHGYGELVKVVLFLCNKAFCSLLNEENKRDKEHYTLVVQIH